MAEGKKKLVCTTCREEIGKLGVIFSCPKCGKEEIARCLKCKKLSAEYKCSKCNFVGP